MAVADVAGGKFEIGRVTTRTFEVIRANFLSFFVLGVLATLPSFAFSIATALGALPTTETIATTPAAAPLFFGATFGVVVVGMFFSVILQAALTYGTISYLNNQPVVLGKAMSIGLREFFPLFGIALLVGLGAGGGMILLIVPGVMLLVRWIVAVPARIAEHTGVTASLGRSRDLTNGYRWPVFGTLIVFWLGSGVAQTTAQSMMVAGKVTGGEQRIFVGATLNAVVTAIIAVASATLIASIYYELRLIKEGVGPAQIASVFD